jgi:hypothetical protein
MPRAPLVRGFGKVWANRLVARTRRRIFDEFTREKNMKRFVFAGLILALAGCGGGGGGNDDTPAAANGPGGLFVGYYQENPGSADPTAGVVYLNLPASDGQFTGNMYFTYVGCQSESIGAVAGSKSGAELTGGSWQGSIDGENESGAFQGTYSATRGSYAGTYTVSAGPKQRNIAECVSYEIAADGSFELFPAEQSTGMNALSVDVDTLTLSWTCPTNSTAALVSLLDATRAATPGSGNAVVDQAVVTDLSDQSLVLNAALLTSGQPYLAGVACLDASGTRTGVSSVRFTAP